MNLYEITDYMKTATDYEEAAWHLIWAWGTDEALMQGAYVYEHLAECLCRRVHRDDWDSELLRRCNAPKIDEVQEILSCRLIESVGVPPRLPHPHEERRYFVMRLAGWREDGDRQCEDCGLFPMGLTTFCEGCWRCGFCVDGNHKCSG